MAQPKEEDIQPVPDLATTSATPESVYDIFGLENDDIFDLNDYPEETDEAPAGPTSMFSAPELVQIKQKRSAVDLPSPFEITENVIYDPPHVSPRIRAQDGVLLACYQPLQSLEEKDYLEIIITCQAHDDLRRRLDQYGVFDKQLFPDLDGIAKWLKYRMFDTDGKC
jgi:hypothetical protein